MYYPSLKEAGAIAASGAYRKIPVSRVLLSDFITPIQALRVLRAQSGHCFLLESAADQEGWGRWTFLGFEPELEITAKDGVVQLRDGERTSSRIQHPGEALRQILSEHKSPKIPGQPPFTGGAQKPPHPRPAPLHRRPGGIFLLRLHEVRRANPPPHGGGPGEVQGHGSDAVPQRHRL